MLYCFQDFDSCGWLRTHRVVKIDLSTLNDCVLIDNEPSGHGKHP